MKHLLLPALLFSSLATPVFAQHWQKPASGTYEQRTAKLPISRPPVKRPNIVLILGDDMGVNLTGVYAEATSPPCTPAIDNLATNGLLFRNAWTNPVCSPTRAALMTGRYGFRTGIGTALTGNSDGLLLTETTLPQVLSGYDTSAVGKWHLGGGQDDLHPNAVGFGYFAGVMGGGLPNYEAWNKTTNGVTNSTTTYATTDTANEGILAINTMQEPWFLYMNFNAPHTPLHVPPTELCSTAFCFAPTCNNLGMNPSSPDLAKAMVEALDTELSRFLDALDQVDPDAYVIFMGDNGTAGQNNEPPFASNHAKGTVYEGGLNVPFIVRGPGVAIGESQALICSTDLFATIAELAGYDTFAEDSVSMVPIFGAPELSMRSFVYSETFTPNAPAVATRHDRAIFDGRYKLIRKLNTQPEFYDLLMDEFETNNLIPGLTPPQQQARAAMMAELVALGVN